MTDKEQRIKEIKSILDTKLTADERWVYGQQNAAVAIEEYYFNLIKNNGRKLVRDNFYPKQ